MNYKEIIENVLRNGVPKQATRLDSTGNVVPVENGTIGTFCEIFRHNMADGFPLTTLRKMPWQSIRVELEGFIKGITDKSWYQERKCKFWNEWGNPVKVGISYNVELHNIANNPEDKKTSLEELKKQIQLEENDLGPVYGSQWRNFGQHYGNASMEQRVEGKLNGVDTGADQLKSIVDKLKTNPYDRRMVCSAWNPNQEHLMALPSCHVLWNIVVYGNKLNLVWFQRSVDSSHGLPANIASYGLLLMLLCKESGLEPGELVGTLSDCHLYNNTLEAVKTMVEREEKQLPTLNIKSKTDGSFSIFDWNWNDTELIGYDPHPAIEMGKVTV